MCAWYERQGEREGKDDVFLYTFCDYTHAYIQSQNLLRTESSSANVDIVSSHLSGGS